MIGWKLQLAIGILSAIAGIIVLFNPFTASIAATLMAGWLFLILGIAQIIEGFSADGWGGKIWSILLGIVAAIVGFNLLSEPLSGVLALTLVLGILFLVSGVAKIVFGLRVHSSQLKWGLIISGVASLIVAFIILTNFPFSATAALGVLLGIEMLSNGIAGIMFALSRKSGGTQPA